MPLHRRDRPEGRRGVTEGRVERRNPERAISTDKKMRFLSNQQTHEEERPSEIPQSEPINSRLSTLNSNNFTLKKEPKVEPKDQPKAEHRDQSQSEPKCEAHPSSVIDNAPTQSEETYPITLPETSSLNQQKLLSLSRQISFETKEFVRKFQQIEEKIKDGCDKVKRRGRPPSKRSQLLSKKAEKSIMQEKIFDSEASSTKDKSIVGEPRKKRKGGRSRNTSRMNVSTSSHLTKRTRNARAGEVVKNEKSDKGSDKGEKEVKRIRQLEGSVGSRLEYLVEYEPRKYRVMGSLELIQKHPFSFAAYLDSKI